MNKHLQKFRKYYAIGPTWYISAFFCSVYDVAFNPDGSHLVVAAGNSVQVSYYYATILIIFNFRFLMLRMAE